MYRSALACLAVAAAAPALAAPSLSATLLADASTPDSSCTRAFLQAATETYLKAQTAGHPATLLALSGAGAPIVYTEDGVARDPAAASGALSLPLRIDYNASLLDTTQCATFTELIVTDPKNPRVIGTQMRFASAAAAAAPTLVKVESLVTQAGDWAFNATGTLHYADLESKMGKWAPILPASERDSRATIQAAADAYMDLFNNKSVVVPWGTPCDRLEGSMYTGNFSATDSCNVGVPFGVRITHRRYVIDETIGAVDALVAFATRPDSHAFRVVKGKIVQVHTLTIMRNITGLPTKRSVPAVNSLGSVDAQGRHSRMIRRSMNLW